MYKLRVGNDINIQWRILRDGTPEDFAGKELRLLMRGTSQTIEVTGYTIEGNVLKWTYLGKDQKGPITFTFTLIENEGKEGMFTIDKCDVLRLVSCSCQADDDDGPFDVFVDTDVVLPAPGRTPVIEAGDTVTLEPGSEATAEVVRNGEDKSGNPKYKVNLGIPAGEPFTYDDFTPEQIEEIKKPAVDAAAAAKTAADAATEAAANADNAAKKATEAATSANDAADGAGQAAVDAGLAKTAAEEAAMRATEAAGAAGSAAEEANSAAQAASQTNTEISTAEQGRVTAEEQRAAAEQTRQTEFSQLKQEVQTATREANAAAQAANQAVENIDESLSAKQDKTDETLQTTDKTIVGGINEVNGKADDAPTLALRKLYIEAGAVYNEETGYYELNGLTDITEEQMLAIYDKTKGFGRYGGIVATRTMGYYEGVRTNIPMQGYGYKVNGNVENDSMYPFGECIFMEVICLNPLFEIRNNSEGHGLTGLRYDYIIAGNVSFANSCKVLKIIYGNIVILGLNENMKFCNYCPLLEEVHVDKLSRSIRFCEASPLINYESVSYLIDNAANTSAITVTVHPTTYSYLTGTAQPSAEVGGTSEEWQALLTTAQGKQISFATTE